jgi:outer membrane lipoprotein SlyB
MRRKSRIVIVAGWLLGITACATPSSPDVYSRNDAMKAWSVAGGEVVDIHAVQIDGTHSAVGTAGGGYVGYEVGRSIGHGSGRAVAGAVGTVAGAVAGRAAETAVTRQSGLQITVRLDGGETIAIVQSADVGFSTGERVKVLRRGNGQARVTKT